MVNGCDFIKGKTFEKEENVDQWRYSINDCVIKVQTIIDFTYYSISMK